MARIFGMPLVAILLTLTVFANAAFAAEEGQMHEAQLTPGWDIFDQTGWGTVTWQYDPGQSDLSGTFELLGALPNHQYTVGVHLFNKDDLTKKPSDANPKVKNFFGKDLGGGCIEREGTSACVDDFDFTTLSTDESGHGKASFEGYIPPGLTYYAQFTVRIGECPGGGCSAVYRTGDKFAQTFEVINT
jgi:hypothetical protein